MRFIASLLAIALIAQAGGASAEAERIRTFGSWAMVCETKASGEFCALSQRIVAGEGGAMVADVFMIVRQVDGFPRSVIAINTPSGVALDTAPAFIVDGEENATTLEWVTCVSGICRATALLSTTRQSDLMTGAEMVIGYRGFASGEIVRFPVSLTGITAGLTELAARVVR